MRSQRNSTRALLAAVALLPAPAFAQASADEIIVTARKRQESLLNVPVITTVLPKQQLESFQINDLKAVSTLVPGLTLGQSLGSIGTFVSIRGVGTTSTNQGIDQSVALNLDGLQLTQGLAYGSSMFDLGQIEVLKGPQSLFYGKNSPGGVIAVRSADPTSRAEIIARYGYEGVAREHRGELIVSGPITETLRGRLAGFYDAGAGYFLNDSVAMPATGAIRTSRRNIRNRNYLARATILWSPAPSFDVRVKANIARDKAYGGVGLQYTSCPDGTAGTSGYDFLAGENCRLDRHNGVQGFDPNAYPGVPRGGGAPYNDVKQKFGTVELNARPIPGITVTSTTGYYNVFGDSTSNGGAATGAGTTFVSATLFRRRDLTQEVRVNSDFRGMLNFSAGLFYQDANLGVRLRGVGNSLLRLPALIYSARHRMGIDSLSAFGQIRLTPLPGLELAAGARWTDESRNDLTYTYPGGVETPFRIATPKISAKNVSPEFTASYRPTDNVTVFGSYKKGFKSGSFTTSTLSTVGQEISFGDEKVKGWEAGIKTRLLDHRLNANLAYYDYRYAGLQVGTSLATPGGGIPQSRTVNAGGAHVYGVDFDMSYRPPIAEGLELRAAVNWNHARFTSLFGVPCWGGQTIAAGCNQVLNPVSGLFTAQDLSGLRLVRAPDWQATFGFNYSMPLSGGKTLSFGNSNQYSSKYLGFLGTRPDFYQHAFVKSDLNIGLSGKDKRWEVSLVGRNIGDKLTFSNCQTANGQGGALLGGQVTGGTGRGPAGIDEVACYIERGREVWLKLTFRFL